MPNFNIKGERIKMINKILLARLSFAFAKNSEKR
jgi:hypothetical protein